MLGAKKFCAIAIVLALTLGVLPHQNALASSECSIAVDPSIIATNAQAELHFDIANTGTDPIGWIQIQRPTASYTVTNVAPSQWTDATDETGTTLTGGTIAVGASTSIHLSVLAAPQEEETSTWTVRLSPSSDGSDMFTCTGTTDTTINAPPQLPVPNGESAISVDNITPTSATVAWQSNVASTSYIYYGSTGAYGQIATAPGSDTSHSVSLANLAPNSLYHYMVAGSDASAHNVFSTDNTFMTPAIPLPPQLPAPPVTPAIDTFGAVQNDTSAPSVTISPLAKSYATAPTIHGNVTDNGLVARVQYSIDGGRNWLNADTASGLGRTSASFSFAPYIQGDGNYQIIVAATDSNGNVGQSQPTTLIIDRLPPQIGPPVISYGSEALTPDTGGTMTCLEGASYRITASAVGGATAVMFQARPIGQSAGATSSFTLAQSTDDGLWQGSLNFKYAGTYQLIATGLDGAGNKTLQPMTTMIVNPAGHLTDASSHQPIKNAKVTLHFFEPSTRSWQIWDGAPYRQTNPQLTRNGGYNFTVPAGTYFITAEASQHLTYTSNSFEVTKPRIVAAPIQLKPLAHISIGSFTIYQPNIDWQSTDLPPSVSAPTSSTSALIGQQLPSFELPTISGSRLNSLNLQGHPTDIVILATWSSESQNQLPALADAQTHNDVNVTPLFSQQRAGAVSAYLAIAGFKLSGLVDPDGIVTPMLQASAQPMHLFIDRRGHVKKVTLGVLSKNEMLDTLGEL